MERRMKKSVKRAIKITVMLFAVVVLAAVFMPASSAISSPDISPSPSANPDAGTFPFDSLGEGITAEGADTTAQIIILLTLLTILPSLLIMMTSFTRIIIVLSFMRNAIGVQQMPPNQVLVGLALFLSFFVMSPVITDVYEQAYLPYESGEVTQIGDALNRGLTPIRGFMYEQIRLQGGENDLRTFISLADMDLPETVDDIPTHVLVPAFITSELKTAFKIGFLIYIPFIAIDMIVASVLMSMGMMMLPPVMISLPFKIMVFVLVDGWTMTITSLIRTFKP